MPRRNFNIERGTIHLDEGDEIACHQIPIGNGQSKFSCRLYKLRERNQPSFKMGDFEEIRVEKGYFRIKNSVAFPPPGVKRPQVEFYFSVEKDRNCSVSPPSETDYHIGKYLNCSPY